MPSELLNTVSPVRCLSTPQPMAIADAIRHKPLKKKYLRQMYVVNNMHHQAWGNQPCP